MHLTSLTVQKLRVTNYLRPINYQNVSDRDDLRWLYRQTVTRPVSDRSCRMVELLHPLPISQQPAPKSKDVSRLLFCTG